VLGEIALSAAAVVISSVLQIIQNGLISFHCKFFQQSVSSKTFNLYRFKKKYNMIFFAQTYFLVYKMLFSI